MKKIVTMCPGKVHNGVWRHLKELECTGLTQHIDLEENAGISDDVEWIIFGGCWTDKYDRLAREYKKEGKKIALLHCSPLGQTDICRELTHLNNAISLIDEGRIDRLFVGEEKTALGLKAINKEIKFLPQCLDAEKFDLKLSAISQEMGNKISSPKSENREFDNCRTLKDMQAGLFCSSAPNKNLLNQVVALRIADVFVHTNAFDREMCRFANRIGLRYWKYGYMPESEYYRRILACDFGMQVSFSEAFDYVVAEFLLAGKPVIVSETIDWLRHYPLCAKCDNIQDIVEKIFTVT
ncbi:MAG: hypothetical protein DRO11_05865, partial [Methanobacteriota archaeon]